MKCVNTETETVSLSLSISDNTEFKKNGSVLGDISFELCTKIGKFTKKSNVKYNKNVQEIPFHHEVNTGTRQHSRDLPPFARRENADSRSTATFKKESTDKHLSNPNQENMIKSIKSFGISDPVSVP
jgi:hypothetical protein